MRQRATAVAPDTALNSRNFIQRSTRTSALPGASTPAATKASRAAATLGSSCDPSIRPIVNFAKGLKTLPSPGAVMLAKTWARPTPARASP